MITEQDTKELLAQSKFYESYSRYIESENRYETWNESVKRVMDMHRFYYKDKMSDELSNLIDYAEDLYKKKRFLGAQRALQFGGESLLKHQSRLYNCVSSYADRPEFFGEALYLLLSGAGVGFSVQERHISKLPKILPRIKQSKVFTIPDSIEGWADSLAVLLSSFFEGGGTHPEYEGRKVFFEFHKIREKNSPISGGFRAPGPDPLRNALNKIENILISVAEQKRQLLDIEIYDIVMHASDAVLAGGVRRSATICLFDRFSDAMLNAKTGNWYQTNPQRGRSNNSAVLKRDEVTKEEFFSILERTKQFGEPGFVWVEDYDALFNPCVEIGMYPIMEIDGKKVTGWQGCNLTEINGGAIYSENDFYEACKAASIVGTLQAGYTDFKYLSENSKKIFDREALIGVSVTGWMNSPEILLNEQVQRKGATIVKEWNAKVADMIGINRAARTTACKPSGNASVLLKTASGVHGDHSPKYIRNVQMNKESDIAKLILKTNPNMVEESVWSNNKTDYCISFPVISREGSKYKSELLGVKQLEVVKLIQNNWVEYGTNIDLCVNKTIRHNVSNTITVDNWDEVGEYIYENRDYFAGISLLNGSGDKDYNQSPFTSVLNENEIIERYGVASMFASGLVVSAVDSFGDLWIACQTAQGYGLDISVESHENMRKRDWSRRFVKFASNYFDGDLKEAEYCLKDVFLLHKWIKIQRTLADIDFESGSFEQKEVDADTLASAACVGSAEGCFV